MPPSSSLRPLLKASFTANAANIFTVTAAAAAGVGAYALYSHTVRLESAELVNHDTKRLRFALPDPKQPTGLSLTSAVLTISWPRGSWLPTIRPYTPVNDLSTSYLFQTSIGRKPCSTRDSGPAHHS